MNTEIEDPVEQIGQVLCGLAWDNGALKAEIARLEDEKFEYKQLASSNFQLAMKNLQLFLQESRRSWWNKLIHG